MLKDMGIDEQVGATNKAHGIGMFCFELTLIVQQLDAVGVWVYPNSSFKACGLEAAQQSSSPTPDVHHCVRLSAVAPQQLGSGVESLHLRSRMSSGPGSLSRGVVAILCIVAVIVSLSGRS